jgi:hypothetical protein
MWITPAKSGELSVREGTALVMFMKVHSFDLVLRALRDVRGRSAE